MSVANNSFCLDLRGLSRVAVSSSSTFYISLSTFQRKLNRHLFCQSFPGFCYWHLHLQWTLQWQCHLGHSKNTLIDWLIDFYCRRPKKLFFRNRYDIFAGERLASLVLKLTALLVYLGYYICYASAATNRRRRHCVYRSSFPPTVRPFSVRSWRNIFVVSGGISTKLATNNHHVSKHCWKGFQRLRSKVKVIARTSALFRRRLRHAVESTVRCRRPYCFGFCVSFLVLKSCMLEVLS